MTDKGFPNPEDIQKEFERFVKDRFGPNVQVVAQPFSQRPKNKEENDPSPPKPMINASQVRFDMQPKEVKTYLDRYVIGQDDAKKALAIAVCDHYNHVQASLDQDQGESDFEYAKQNVLILGPTGVGKSYLIKQLAKLIGVPFVKADATRFSETGYVGANVDDLVKDLVKQADDNIELAQFGMIYLDEADKLAGASSASGRDVSGRGVQFGLLKLMEETEVDLRGGNDIASQMQAFMDFQRKGKVDRQVINTKHILFIVSGAFTGLEEIIAQRLNTNRIGFISEGEDSTHEDEDLLAHASTNDFLQYGLEPEFIGRLPVRVACRALSKQDLFEILENSEGSIIKQYVRAFAAYGIKAEFERGALERIAELAHEQKTGARALLTVCEQILRDYKFELPSTPIKHLLISRALVDNPQFELEKLLNDPHNQRLAAIIARIREYEKSFATRFGMVIHFDDNAMAMLAERIDFDSSAVETFCDQCLQSYEHGLKLIQQNTGQNGFTLTEDVVKNPRMVLERWIRDSYNNAD